MGNSVSDTDTGFERLDKVQLFSCDRDFMFVLIRPAVADIAGQQSDAIRSRDCAEILPDKRSLFFC